MNRASENNMNVNRTKQSSTPNIRWMLVVYDLIVYAVVAVILLVLYGDMAGFNVIFDYWLRIQLHF